MATHFSILAGKVPWAEEPGGLLSMGSQSVNMSEQLSVHAHTFKTFPVGEKPKFLLFFERVRNCFPKALFDYHNIVVFNPGSSLNHLRVFF